MTKRAIVTLVLNELKQPFNHELYERISDRVVALRAKYLRQSIGKYGIDELLQQTYIVKMVKTKDDDGCIYYETECKIVTPIRAIGSASPFKFVGTKSNRPFTFLRAYEVDTIPSIPVNAKHKYYSIENKKIRTYNVTPTEIKITDIFESFDELLDMCNDVDCVDDDTALPMPADFVDLIVKDLVQELGQVSKTDNETKVEE